MTTDDETPSLSERQPSDSSENLENAIELPGSSKKPMRQVTIVTNRNDKRQEVQISESLLADLKILTTDIETHDKNFGDDDVEDGVDVLVTNLSKSIDNFQTVGENLEFTEMTGESMRETFLQEEKPKMVYSPRGHVDLRPPDVETPTSFRKVLYQ